MAGRMLYLKVGDEAVRGPLPEASIRDSFRSGVLSEDTLVGEREDALAPIATVLGPRDAAPVAPAPSQGGKKKALVVVLGLGAALLLVGIVGGVVLWWRNRPPPLCKATPHVLAGLTAELDVRLYVTKRGKKLTDASHRLERLLRAMQVESHGRMSVRVIDTAESEEARLQAKEDGLQEQVFGEGSGDDVQIAHGYFGLSFREGAEKDKIASLPPDTDTTSAEFWVTNKIREISAKVSGKKQRIGVLVGHHEIQLGDANLVPHQQASMRSIITQYFPYYALVDVDLRGGSSPVPDEVDGLLVTQPEDDLTEAELRRLDEHVMRGKPLAIVASAATVKRGDAHMNVTLSAHGLDRLSGAYGIEIGKDLVFDEKAAHKTSVMTTTGATSLVWPYLPIAREKEGLDTASTVFFRIPEITFPLASSITLHPERQPGAKLRALARTTTSAVRDARASIALEPLKPEKGTGPSGEVVLSATAEGPLKSAFGDAKSQKPSRVLVISSSLFFANPFVHASRADTGQLGMMFPDADDSVGQLAMPYAQQILTSTILVLKNVLDWVTFDDDLGGCLPQTNATSDTKKK